MPRKSYREFVPYRIDGVWVPRPETREKYGLSVDEWVVILRRQGSVCACCRRVPKSGRLNIDHFHVKGWKDMKPERRKTFVRGLICYWDNRTVLARGATPAKLRNAASYLEEYESRRPVDQSTVASQSPSDTSCPSLQRIAVTNPSTGETS